MQIYIPTYRRTGDQHTLKALPTEWQSRTTLVVDELDADKIGFYARTGKTMFQRAKLLIVPDHVTTIAKKRAFIIEQAREDKIVMFDDDLRFAARYYPGCDATSPKLEKAQPEAIAAALEQLSAKLDDYVHAGFSARQGNNRLDYGWLNTRRMMYALGYRPKVVREVCDLGRIETREDFDYTLQLFSKGLDNVVYSELCVDQSYNAKGGCSEQRTMEASNADAERLAELHPGLVKVVEKDYKASVPRKEVIVQWKKALEQGQQ